jgi:hypothetical protein
MPEIWAGGVAQAVEHLFSKHEVLNSNPSSPRRNKEILKSILSPPENNLLLYPLE